MECVKLNNTKHDIEKFINFEKKLYAHNKYNAHSINSMKLSHFMNEESLEQRDNFEYFMVYDGKKPLARAAFAVFNTLNKKIKKSDGHVFYFAAINNYNATKLLFDKIKENAIKHGVSRIILNSDTKFSNFGKGILCTAEDEIISPVQNFNFLYYKDLLMSYGFRIHDDQNNYSFSINDFAYDKNKIFAEKAKQRFNFYIKELSINKNNIESISINLVSLIHQCYEAEWEIPQPSLYDIQQELSEVMKFSSDKKIFFAYSEERLIAAFLIYSDYSLLLNKCNGKLFPTYYLSKLLGIYSSKDYIASMILVAPDFRLKGVDIAMVCQAYKHIKNAQANSIEICATPALSKKYYKVFSGLGGKINRIYSTFEIACNK